MSTIPANKQELTAAIRDNFDKLMKELHSIRDKEAGIRTMEGHAKNTLISVRDLLSYLIGWGELVLKWNRKRDDGERVDFPETGFKWNALGQLAQKFYSDYENEGYEALTNKLDDTVQSILTLVESKTDEELYGLPWYEKYTLGRMIQLNTSSPYKNALGRLKKWKKYSSRK
jgi:hypothetical protein